MLFQSYKEKIVLKIRPFLLQNTPYVDVWKTPNLQGICFLKMAVCGADFLLADDIDDIMAKIDASMLKNNTKTIKNAV